METRTKEKEMMICPKAKECRNKTCSYSKPHTRNRECLESIGACPACVPVESPKPNSKGIHIIGRKVVRDGVEGRIVDKVVGMKTEQELPKEYCDWRSPNCSYPCCFINDQKTSWCGKCGAIIILTHYLGGYISIELGKFIIEPNYQRYIKLINHAGENLAKINKELREKKEVPFEDVI